MDFYTFKVKTTSLPLGLQLNKKGFAYGFVIESNSLIDATDRLNDIEKKWRTWINDFNTWVGLPPAEQVKFHRQKAA